MQVEKAALLPFMCVQAPCSQVTFMFLAYSGIVVLAYPPSPLHFNSFKPELTGLPSWTYDNAVYGMKTGRTIIQGAYWQAHMPPRCTA